MLLTWLLGAWALWRRPSLEGFVRASFWFLLIYLMFGTLWFQPWYTPWPLALAALLDWKPAGRTMAVFTATVGITYCPWPAAWLLVVYVPVLALIIYHFWGVLRRGWPTGVQCTSARSADDKDV